MSLKVWKKNSRKEKQKKIKKNKKRKNLTPSSSKTIFHTLITLKRYILGTPCNQKKIVQKQGCLQLQKNSKKIKISKKRKRFYFVDQSKIWIYIQKIFLTFNNWQFSNVRLMNLQIFFLFWKISQSILLRVSHPKKKVSPCPLLSRSFQNK